MSDSTLGKIQALHGCDACKFRRADEWLVQHSKYYCLRAEITMDSSQTIANAQPCCDWQLVADKDERKAFIDEAQGQPGLPL
jgi:hypothetical protein